MNDESYAKLDKFNKDLKKLVRDIFPECPCTMPEGSLGDEAVELLYAMQDATSLFSPYIWSNAVAPTPPAQ